jgi:hypothetical protein
MIWAHLHFGELKNSSNSDISFTKTLAYRNSEFITALSFMKQGRVMFSTLLQYL